MEMAVPVVFIVLKTGEDTTAKDTMAKAKEPSPPRAPNPAKAKVKSRVKVQSPPNVQVSLRRTVRL
jgi:hypothetical protein